MRTRTDFGHAYSTNKLQDLLCTSGLYDLGTCTMDMHSAQSACPTSGGAGVIAVPDEKFHSTKKNKNLESDIA